jgi:hypothetical protein
VGLGLGGGGRGVTLVAFGAVRGLISEEFGVGVGADAGAGGGADAAAFAVGDAAGGGGATAVSRLAGEKDESKVRIMGITRSHLAEMKVARSQANALRVPESSTCKTNTH